MKREERFGENGAFRPGMTARMRAEYENPVYGNRRAGSPEDRRRQTVQALVCVGIGIAIGAILPPKFEAPPWVFYAFFAVLLLALGDLACTAKLRRKLEVPTLRWAQMDGISRLASASATVASVGFLAVTLHSTIFCA